MKKRIILVIVICILLIISYFLFDYINVLSVSNINTTNINYNFLSIFINNIVIIGLYIITYFIVDAKNIKIYNNKKAIVKYMLVDDYNTCLSFRELYKDKTILSTVVKNIDGDSFSFNNEYLKNLKNVSFKNYTNIVNYSEQGIINVKILKQYFLIRENYFSIVSGYILTLNVNKEVKCAIDEKSKNLIEEIDKELAIISKLNSK